MGSATGQVWSTRLISAMRHWNVAVAQPWSVPSVSGYPRNQGSVCELLLLKIYILLLASGSFCHDNFSPLFLAKIPLKILVRCYEYDSDTNQRNVSCLGLALILVDAHPGRILLRTLHVPRTSLNKLTWIWWIHVPLAITSHSTYIFHD